MRKVFIAYIVFCCCVTASIAQAADDSGIRAGSEKTSRTASGKLKPQTALMCEDMQDHRPVNPSVVFAVAAGKVFCFTVFNSVQEKTHVYHAWYHEDKLITKRKLSLEQPQWKTYSSIQLREDDKGPWRVEILDQSDRVLETLRFSITD